MPNRFRKNLSGATSSLDILFLPPVHQTLSKRALAKKVREKSPQRRAASIPSRGVTPAPSEKRKVACGGLGEEILRFIPPVVVAHGSTTTGSFVPSKTIFSVRKRPRLNQKSMEHRAESS